MKLLSLLFALSIPLLSSAKTLVSQFEDQFFVLEVREEFVETSEFEFKKLSQEFYLKTDYRLNRIGELIQKEFKKMTKNSGFAELMDYETEPMYSRGQVSFKNQMVLDLSQVQLASFGLNEVTLKFLTAEKSSRFQTEQLKSQIIALLEENDLQVNDWEQSLMAEKSWCGNIIELTELKPSKLLEGGQYISFEFLPQQDLIVSFEYEPGKVSYIFGLWMVDKNGLLQFILPSYGDKIIPCEVDECLNIAYKLSIKEKRLLLQEVTQ